MKKIFVGLLVALTSHSFAQFTYPDYTEVYEKFYTKYDDVKDGKPVYVEFAKKADGWYIKMSTPEDYETKTYYPFWSKKNNQWLPLSFGPAEPNSFTPIDDYRVPYMFRVSPMYGYNGWYKDVIDSLGNKPVLSDTQLYALDKAYFNHLTAAFGNQYGDYIKTDVLSEKIVPNTFSQDDLAELRKRYDRLIKTTQRMQAQNPDFETFIGSLTMQYSNDVMDMFMRMYLYQNKEEADKYLEKDLYDPYILDYAKYNLFSCPPNAILFTNGDNDTYPLWYAQYALGVRTDVAVINRSLLNYREYASMIRKYGIVNYITKEENVLSENFSYVLITDRNAKMDQAGLTQFLQQDLTGTEVPYITGGTFVFTLNGKTYELPHPGYIYKGDLLIMDIIYTNTGKRPVCFILPNSPYTELLEPGLEYTQLVTIGTTAKDHADQLMKIWGKDFSLSDYTGFKGHFSKNHHQLINEIVIDMAFKCNILVKEGKKEAANAMVTRLDNSFSPAILKRDHAWVYVAAILGKTGDPLGAEKVMDQVIANEWQEVLKKKNGDETRLSYFKQIKPDVIKGEFNF